MNIVCLQMQHEHLLFYNIINLKVPSDERIAENTLVS